MAAIPEPSDTVESLIDNYHQQKNLKAAAVITWALAYLKTKLRYGLASAGLFSEILKGVYCAYLGSFRGEETVVSI